MSLPFPARPGNDWSQVIADKLAPMFNATIQIVNPNTASHTPWDPDTDAGGVDAPTVVWEGLARITKVRFPKQVPTPTEMAGASRFRFQLPRDPNRPFIPAGYQIFVVDGGKEPQLEQLTYVIIMTLNDSWAPITTIETEAEITAGATAPAVAA